MGKSLYEADTVDEAKRLLTTCNIPVPSDVRVATEFSETAPATLKSVNDVKLTSGSRISVMLPLRNWLKS